MRRSATRPRRPCIALRSLLTSTRAVTTVSLPAGIERDLKRTGVLGVLPFLRVLRSRRVPEIETVHGMSQRTRRFSDRLPKMPLVPAGETVNSGGTGLGWVGSTGSGGFWTAGSDPHAPAGAATK